MWQCPKSTFEANIYQNFKSFEQIIFRRCSSSDWRPSCGAKFPVQFLAPDGSLTVDFVLIYSNMLKYTLTYQTRTLDCVRGYQDLRGDVDLENEEELVNFPNSVTESSKENEWN